MSVSRSGRGGPPPPPSRRAPVESSPDSIQAALREVQPDDLDTVFDKALFGSPAEEKAASVEPEPVPEPVGPVQVGAVGWFFERHSQALGPFRLERLRELWHHGDIGPDTFCWCEGWTDWRPLSRVPELVTALTDAGLPTLNADASLPAPPASGKAPGSEVKKVASVLPSLVAEEESFLRQMEEQREQAAQEQRASSLLSPSAPAPPVAPAAMPVAPPQVVAPAAPPAAPAELPSTQVMTAPAAPASPEAPARPRRDRRLVAGALLGAGAAGLVAGALLLLPQVRRPPSQELEDVAPPAAAPAVAQAAPEVVQARTQADTPETERPASPSPEKPPPARVAAAPEKPPPARIAAATARPPEKQEPRARAPARPSAPVASARPAEPEREPVASARRVAPSRAQESQEERARAVEPRVERSPRAPPPPPPAPEPRKELPPDHPENFDDALDKAFERELGFADTSPRPKRRANEDRTVWVPPSIGQKSLPDSLSQSDIMAVVVAHKEAIASCIRRYSPPTPASGKGRFVVRWRVHPGGNLSDVALETDSLKDTPFARCIEGEIRSWTFPEHRVQRREPIRFPFTY